MNSRERVLAAINFQEPDRIPVMERVWFATILRWQAEGLPKGISVADYFDYDIFRLRADTSPRFPVEVLDEHPGYMVDSTPNGGKIRIFKDFRSTPEILAAPCKTPTDWQNIKERLLPSRERFDWDGKRFTLGPLDPRTTIAEELRKYKDYLIFGRRDYPGYCLARQKNKCIVYDAIVGYDKIQSYEASEDLLVAIVTEPEWVRDMYETDANLVIETCAMIRQGGVQFDAAYLLCDLGYRNGLLFSQCHFDEQLHPTFQLLIDYFNTNHMPVLLHCDGQVSKLIPYLIKEGLHCLGELKVKAGMDLVSLEDEWGDRLAFMGRIDARLFREDDFGIVEDGIRKKVPVANRGGGYIFHSDHSNPPNVSFSRYQQVLALVQENGGAC